jgi:hypothetical protein
VTWKKFAFGQAFREPCSKALELDVQKGAKKWYSDTTNLGVLKDEDTQWFMETIVPAMLKAGINKQALIVPKSVISQISLNHAAEAAGKIGLQTQYFDNPTAALAWLK